MKSLPKKVSSFPEHIQDEFSENDVRDYEMAIDTPMHTPLLSHLSYGVVYVLLKEGYDIEKIK